MVSAELQRRSLSPSQRAAVAVALEEYRQARVAADSRRRANLRSEVAALPPQGKTRVYFPDYQQLHPIAVLTSWTAALFAPWSSRRGGSASARERPDPVQAVPLAEPLDRPDLRAFGRHDGLRELPVSTAAPSSSSNRPAS
jgi:hypothetical protein